MKTSFQGQPRHQQGAALLVALIMLLILTLIGVSGMQDSIVEERMSGSFINRDVAFQSAETALREGESWLATRKSPPTTQHPDSCDTACRNDMTVWQEDMLEKLNESGAYDAGGTYSPQDQGATWWATNGEELPSSRLSRVSVSPRYVSEFVGFNLPDATGRVEVSDTDEIARGVGPYWYRFVAQSQGQTDRSSAVIEAVDMQRF